MDGGGSRGGRGGRVGRIKGGRNGGGSREWGGGVETVEEEGEGEVKHTKGK